MLKKEIGLADVSTESEAAPVNFIISEDGRSLLAVTGQQGYRDAVLQLTTTPIVYIQQDANRSIPIVRFNGEPSTIGNSSVIQFSLEHCNSVTAQTMAIAGSDSSKIVQSGGIHIEGNSGEILSGAGGTSMGAEEIVPDLCGSTPKKSRGRPKKKSTSINLNNTGKLKCDICGEEFSKMTLHRRHMEHHAAEKPHRCPKCSASFNVPTNFTLHMATHNTGEPKCPECGKKFARMASLKSHMVLHQKEESLFCTECEDSFSTMAQLEAHLKLHNEKWSSEDVRKCKLCHKQFTQPALYRLHIREHYRSKIVKKSKKGTGHKTTHKCNLCLKSFEKPSQMMRHIRVHTGEKPYKCNICTRAFTQKGSLRIHTWKHIGVRPYRCEFCNAKFSQKGNLNAHILRVHSAKEGDPIYSCSLCTCVFKRLGSLNGHMKRMHSNPPEEEESEKRENWSELADMRATVEDVMSQLASLDAPEGSVEKVIPSQGPGDILQEALQKSGLEDKKKVPEDRRTKAEPQTCFVTLLDRGQDGSLRKYLTIKQRCIGSVRWYSCNFCHKEFKKPSDLIRHLRVHTQEKPFKCSSCLRSFALKSTLRAHERRHADLKEFSCGSCNKTFASQSCLSSHVRTHAKSYKCDMCDKSYASLSLLKYHVSSHERSKSKVSPEVENLVERIVLEEPLLISDAGEKMSVSHLKPKQRRVYEPGDEGRPHKCWVCPAAFTKISHLKQHYLRHTGERPHKCPKCDRRFTSNSVLKSHLHTHEESRPYSCAVCGAKFSTRSSMKRHAVTHSNLRPFMCPYCQKTFKTSVNCRKHMKIHKSELAEQQLEHQRSLNVEDSLSKDKISPDLPENLGLNEEVEVTFQSQIAPDFTQAFNDQFQGISKEKTYLVHDGIARTIESDNLAPVESDNLAGSQTLHADETGTITLPNYSADESLTPESIREIEETLNQQLFNIGMSHDPNHVNLSSREHHSAMSIVFDNGKSLEPVNNVTIASNIFPAHFDTFDMSQITLQADTEIDMGISTANSTSMASILPRSAQEEQSFVPVTENCCNTDDSPGKSAGRHLVVASCVQTCPELSRPALACRKSPKVKGDGTDASNIEETEPTSNSQPPNLPKDGDGYNVECGGINRDERKLVDDQQQRLRDDTSETAEERLNQMILGNSQKNPVDEETASKERKVYSNKCKYCPKTFRKPSDLVRHVRTHTGERPYQCEFCEKSFAVKCTLDSHTKVHTGKKTFCCHVCSSLFATKGSLKVHMRLHTGAKPFGCRKCDLQFRTSGHRKVHELTHERQGKEGGRRNKQSKVSAIAQVVAQVEKTVEELKVSKNTENPLEKMVFPNLETITINPGATITDHITFNLDGTIMNNDSTLSVNESDQLVANLHFLLANGLVTIQADGDVPMVSELAPEVLPVENPPEKTLNNVQILNEGTAGSPRKRLDTRRKKISKDRPGSAPLGSLNVQEMLGKNCPQTVKPPDSSKASNSKKECDICGKMFMKPCQVERHKRIHTGERPFKCELCDKSFAQKTTLQTHQKSHTGDRPYPCPHCHYSFTQKGNLQTHLRRAHQLDALQSNKFSTDQQHIFSAAKFIQPEDESRIFNFEDISIVEYLK